MSRPKNPVPNIRKVMRLHGELYTALKQEAERLKLKPATMAAHIMQVEAEQQHGGKFRLNPLTEAYLPTHNPRVSDSERAHMLTITLPPEVYEALLHQAEQQVLGEGHKKPAKGSQSPAARRYAHSMTTWTRTILTNCIVTYLDRYHAL